MLRSRARTRGTGICAAALFAAAVFACPAAAQLTNGLQRLVPGTTLSASGSSDLQPGYRRDVIGGSNSRGPYALSWARIPASRETVRVDGRAALRGVDYSIDYSKGAITFTSVLKGSSLAMVDYPADAASTRNAVVSSIPLALDLYASDRSSLRFTGLYRQDGTQASAQSSVLGLQGKTQLSQTTQLTTSLFTSLGIGGTGGFGDHSAASIGAASSLGQLNLTGSYVRAGQGFTSGKEYGIASGQDVQSLGLSYGPKASRLSFSSGYQRVSREDPQGHSTTSLNHSLKYAFAPEGQFSFARNAAGADIHGDTSSAVTDVLQLASAVGTKSKVLLTWTDASSSAQGIREHASTKVLSVTSGLVQNVAFNAAYRLAETSARGASSALDVGITAKPHKAVEVQAAFAGSGSDADGTDNSGTIRVAAVPNSRIKLSMGISDRQTDSLGQRTRDLRVESNPLDRLTLTGGYAFTDSGASTLVAREIAANAKPLSYLTLSGGYKTREMPGETLDTALFNMTVSPWKSLGIVAALSENPEDSKGNVGHYRAKSLGVKASVGILGMTGAYAFKDEYLADRRWFQTQLGVQLALARSTSLTSDYEYSETEGFGAASRRISVGVRRNLGDDFNLWLTGSRTDVRESAVDYQPTYEAQMKLGIRF